MRNRTSLEWRFPPGVAVLRPAHEDLIERGSRDDTEGSAHQAVCPSSWSPGPGAAVILMGSRMRPSRFLALFLLAAAAGFAIFGIMVWRAVDVVDAAPADAAVEFDRVRARFGEEPPLLTIDAEEKILRRDAAPRSPAAPATRLRVLSYRAAAGRLTRANAALWFLKIKGPAAQMILRDTGLDLEELRLTAADLERLGPAVILDRASASGDRLLMWTE